MSYTIMAGKTEGNVTSFINELEEFEIQIANGNFYHLMDALNLHFEDGEIPNFSVDDWEKAVFFAKIAGADNDFIDRYLPRLEALITAARKAEADCIYAC